MRVALRRLSDSSTHQPIDGAPPDPETLEISRLFVGTTGLQFDQTTSDSMRSA